MKTIHGCLLSLLTATTMLLSTPLAAELSGPPEGRQQLVDALDADGDLLELIFELDTLSYGDSVFGD